MSRSRKDESRSQFLDVETDEQRSTRIEKLLDTTSSSRRRLSPKERPGKYSAPQRLEGPSRLLARLEAFLPELKRANEALDPVEANIENDLEQEEQDDEDHHENLAELADMQGHHNKEDPRHQHNNTHHQHPHHSEQPRSIIEMTLGLGVFELKDGEEEEEDHEVGKKLGSAGAGPPIHLIQEIMEQ